MAGVVVRAKVAIFLIYLITFLFKCEANDILGCGGFVKSHVSLDFSKIEIGLYTKEGSLKEKTECAPTNGYYFLPLYEKGEYVLKVHPPPGWSFEPSEVKLAIDGSTDHCSTGQDINFDFNGFGITGKVVTNGQSQGPSGISVQLVNEKGETRDTVTIAGGDFHFTPVIPGKYTIKASHPRWKLEPSQAAVQVKEGNTALALGSLAVKGYDVRGTVHSYGNPVAGLYVLLYSKEENPKYRVEGCKTALLQGVPDSPICYSVTDGSGQFSFGLVPAGEYKLVALAKPPGQAIVRYNVRPESVPFSVLHDSQFIKNAFEVEGYTITGAVVGAGGGAVAGAGGGAVAGARVSLDGRPVSNTDAAGKYTLPPLQPGAYSLSFHHEQCEFDDVKLSISTSGSVTLNEARAARWKVCGVVTPSDPRDVTITADRSSLVTTVTVSHENNGKWCTFLPPGTYTARVEVSEREKRDGLQFYPVTQKVTVTGAPVEDVTFSQLYATVSGAVECARPECAGVKVTLRSLAVEGAPALTHTTPDKDGKYVFERVLPGTIEVWVPSERLCWAAERHSIRVTSSSARVPHFVHTGYVLTVRSQHAVTVEYKGASEQESGSVSVGAGETRVCVPAAGRYTLTPRSCHKYQPASVLADTSKLDVVSLVAVAHSVDIKVLSPEQVPDLVLKINTNDKGSKDVGPLTAEAAGDHFLYKHTLFLAEGEVIVVSASSSSLLFSPHTPQQVVGTAECQPAGLVLHARQGLTLRGRIVPPVQGAQVTLTSATEDLRLTLTTGPDGTYSFGPLDAAQAYSITAEKESYVMGAPQPNGDILAHKLAEITVELRDEASGALLQGALVSVSGGSYRKNQVSGATGQLRFSSLAPGQYYVKPLMKEYRFSPPHHLLDVVEGLTSAVTLQGTRVAWSCSGALVSLGGAGWARALLSAVPQREGGNCRSEDALTDQDGTFRIRGLVPDCVYSLQLKETADLPALRLATPAPAVLIKESKDIENVRLIAIQPHQLTDANVLVHTPNVEHYKTLRVKLALEATPTAIIYSTKLDATGYHGNNNPGLMYVLPRLPADNKTYVLVLESSLSKSTHTYGEEVLYFTSDGQFKHFDIEFLPKVKTGEQELRQSSLLVVPLLAALALVFLYRETLLTRAAALATSAQPRPTRAAPRPDLLDKASIDHILNTVNATGRKTKTKKIQ